MRATMAAIGLLLVLTACATAPQPTAEQVDDAQCRSYGAQPGTQAYFQCRMAKDQHPQQATAALAGAILSRPQPQPYVLPMPGGR
jgi:hypothetical protein